MTSKLFTTAQAIAAGVVLARLSTGARRLPPVQPTRIDRSKNVSVVIPARNEAARITACLDGLKAQGLAEIIVVDDESTDDTARIAKDHGVSVVTGAPLPEGWVGKPWALQQGLDAAEGEWVMFLDADTIPRRRLIAAAVEAAERYEADVVSLSPRFLTSSTVDQALHASMLATLIYRFGPTSTADDVRPDRVLANGQCMVVRRAWLRAQGGFEVAKANMTDDIAFARGLAARGAKVMFLDGSELLDVRMYESAGETWKEWGRSLPMSDVTAKRTQALDLATVWLTSVLPLLRVVLGRSTVLDKLLVALRFLLCLPMLRSYDKPMPGVLLSPFTDVAAAARLTETTLRPVRTWRGRDYATAGSANQ